MEGPGVVADQVLFGGLPQTPDPAVFEAVRSSWPAWYRALNAAYQDLARRPENAGLYADPEGRGATLEQTWRFFTLFGAEMYCVLVRPLASDLVKGISRLERTVAADLVARLKRLQDLQGALHVTTLHHDGATGHCITLKRYNEADDRFVYHDPWPAKSLLSLENNQADVDARPEGRYWSVTSAELERVLFACFLFPRQQAALDGVQLELTHAAWKQTDFYRFFHLKLHHQTDEDGLDRRSYFAGPFKGQVIVSVDVDAGGVIRAAALTLADDWKHRNAPLAFDIAQSFVRAFTPEPDRGHYEPIVSALRALQHAARNPPEGITAEVVRMIQALLGETEEATMRSDFARLTVGHIINFDEPSIELRFALS